MKSLNAPIGVKFKNHTFREVLNYLMERTGQPIERVMKDIDRDYWMSVDEAKDYGILGTVANSMNDIKF